MFYGFFFCCFQFSFWLFWLFSGLKLAYSDPGQLATLLTINEVLIHEALCFSKFDTGYDVAYVRGGPVILNVNVRETFRG